MLNDCLDLLVSACAYHKLGICIQLVVDIFLTFDCRLVGDKLYIVICELLIYLRKLVIANCDRKATFIVGLSGFLCHPFYKDHCCFLICLIAVCIDTEAVVLICR